MSLYVHVCGVVLSAARKDIAMIKVVAPSMAQLVIDRAIQVGTTNPIPHDYVMYYCNIIIIILSFSVLGNLHNLVKKFIISTDFHALLCHLVVKHKTFVV